MTGSWALAITYCDVKNDVFLMLGAAEFKTKRERDAELAAIPTEPNETDYILDIESARGIEDDRFISARTVERLTKKPLDVLIADARTALERDRDA